MELQHYEDQIDLLIAMDTLHSAGGNHVRDNCSQIGNVENQGYR